MKYAHLEEKTNKILGWYDDEVHKNIPTPSIEASEEVWQEAISVNANVYENSKFIVKDFRTEKEINKDNDSLKIAEAKQYLQETDYKVLPDYDGNKEGILEARAEARELIRQLEG